MLVAAFALSFAAVAAATTALVAFVVFLYTGRVMPLAASSSFADWALGHPSLLGIVALATLGLMLLASVYRAASLAGGGGQVARMLGGSEVPSDATDLARKRLLNVVEEMAIASGLPMPEVYVLEREAGINAFAAGKTPADAAVAVTRGALERLDRAELQGVIAHEFSHIVNGDMRLNQQLIGFSFGILVLSLIGRSMLRAGRFGRRGRSSGAAAAVALGVGFALIGSIGLFASRLIKAGVSRERERLADASAVQFTRDAAGLASALKKIAGYGGRLTATETEEVAHMLFEHHGNAFRGWFATHPPLLERIRALDPQFDPRGLRPLEPMAASAADVADDEPLASAVHGFGQSRGTGAPMPTSAAGGAPELGGTERAASTASASYDAPASPLDRAGELGSLSLGAELRAALPAEIYDAAHSRDGSLLLVLALALAPDPRTRATQRTMLNAQLGPRRAKRCEALRAELDRLDPALRIPILELAVPALKQRPAEQLDYLFGLAAKLTACGGEQRLFDYTLLRMLAAYAAPASAAGIGSGAIRRAKMSIRDACETLLRVVAAYGHDDAETGLAAYRAGWAALGAEPRDPPPLDSMRDLLRLDAALERLERLAPRAKRRVLEAVLATIRHDHRIGNEELELFRAIAATLGCPVPWDIGVREHPHDASVSDVPGARHVRIAD